MHCYFQDPELFERDRTLFRKYMPVFDALNQAGWEPVTHVRADAPEVRVERYGSGRDISLTVYNAADAAKEASLSLECGWWEKALGGEGAITLKSELTGESYRATVAGDRLSCRVLIAPRRTLVLRVQRG